MATYQGFAMSNILEVVTIKKIISSNCMQVVFENKGESVAKIGIKDSKDFYEIEAGSKLAFPPLGNVQPLLILDDWFTIDFESTLSSKKVNVTKVYASPKILTF